MKPRFPFVLATVLIALQGLIGTAHAAPIVTFQVPLKLDNLPPEIAKARITCWILKKDDFVVAVKFVEVPVTGGQYAGPPFPFRWTWSCPATLRMLPAGNAPFNWWHRTAQSGRLTSAHQRQCSRRRRARRW